MHEIAIKEDNLLKVKFRMVPVQGRLAYETHQQLKAWLRLLNRSNKQFLILKISRKRKKMYTLISFYSRISKE